MRLLLGKYWGIIRLLWKHEWSNLLGHTLNNQMCGHLTITLPHAFPNLLHKCGSKQISRISRILNTFWEVESSKLMTKWAQIPQCKIF